MAAMVSLACAGAALFGWRMNLLFETADVHFGGPVDVAGVKAQADRAWNLEAAFATIRGSTVGRSFILDHLDNVSAQILLVS
jgi:hypothetical protein